MISPPFAPPPPASITQIADRPIDLSFVSVGARVLSHNKQTVELPSAFLLRVAKQLEKTSDRSESVPPPPEVNSRQVWCDAAIAME